MFFVQLNPNVSLERGADENLLAIAHGRAIGLGRFGAEAAERVGAGLQYNDGLGEKTEIAELVRRLSLCGMLEYRLARSEGDENLAIIEPQTRDYVPHITEVGDDDALALSRFAYIRRRGGDIVLESPLSPALFRLRDPAILVMLAHLAEPRTVKQLRNMPGFAGLELLGMLIDCRLAFTPTEDGGRALRFAEGDPDLVLWDFHDLLFHTRSTSGRHANPSGGRYAYAHVMEMPPAVRPAWPGAPINLRGLLEPCDAATSPLAQLLRRRRSTRSFDDRQPITLAELSRFLDATARVCSRERVDGDDGSEMEFASRPYPSGGSSYELELYLAVGECAGLAPGFYHYDAGRHALTPIAAKAEHLRAMLGGAQHHIGSPTPPQIVITIAARFARVSWKYSAIAYALTLKHVGVAMQTFYLMATEMELGACAIGAVDIDLFARMTGVELHIESAVGQMAIGRGLAANNVSET